ncbi:MAG TPA: hypothetical protein VIN37_01435 [Candidatus Limnocylindria bacterium]
MTRLAVRTRPSSSGNTLTAAMPGGCLTEDRDRDLLRAESNGAFSVALRARALHREDDVAGVLDRGRQRPILVRVRRVVVEADVEGDEARRQGLQRGQQIDPGLPRERIRAVAADGLVIQRDDRQLVRQRARRVRDERVVRDGLEGRVEEVCVERKRPEKDAEGREGGKDDPLALQPLREHPFPLRP